MTAMLPGSAAHGIALGRRGKSSHRRGLSALVLTLACAGSSGQSQPPYTIDFHSISAGAQSLQNNCFRLSGTVGEIAPGYSSSGTYSLYAGFRAAAGVKAVDEIFFAGFEEC